jgi:hypothetical protein
MEGDSCTADAVAAAVHGMIHTVQHTSNLLDMVGSFKVLLLLQHW